LYRLRSKGEGIYDEVEIEHL
jgi:hypothetical protein